MRESEYIVVGRIVAPRGLLGELKVAMRSPEHVLALQEVWLGESHIPFVVKGARVFKGHGLLQLEGIADRDAAENWRGAWVYVDQQNAPELDDDEYYIADLIGMRVITQEGEDLGEIIDVIETGANDVYVVQGSLGELLLPAISDVILDVDLDEGLIKVHLLDGLR